MFYLLFLVVIGFIGNRKPGPLGQVRDTRLCHRNNLHKVSGVSKNRILNTDLFVTAGEHRRKNIFFMSRCDTSNRNLFLKPDTRNLKPKHGLLNVIIKNPCGVN
jgi:hypothetical protein